MNTHGPCCVPGCNHPNLSRNSEYCPVHARVVWEFSVWLNGFHDRSLENDRPYLETPDSRKSVDA